VVKKTATRQFLERRLPSPERVALRVRPARDLFQPAVFWAQPFTYLPMEFGDPHEIPKRISQCVHPYAVLVDSSLVNDSRVDLLRHLLVEHQLFATPEVIQELASLRKQVNSSVAAKVVWRDGKLHPRIRPMAHSLLADRGLLYPLNHYSGLLGLRKQMHRASHVKIMSSDERHRYLRQQQHRGLSPRTLKISGKEYRSGHDRINTNDEILTTSAMLAALALDKDIYLLTADNDVCDQVLQLASVLHSDYGGYIVGRWYSQDPSAAERLPAIDHPLFDPARLADGFRVARPSDMMALVRDNSTRAITVIDVGRLWGFTWIMLRDMLGFLRAKASTNGLNYPGFDGRNVLVGVPPADGQPASDVRPFAHFVYDKMLSLTGSGNARLTAFDLERAATDPPMRGMVWESDHKG